MSSKDLIDLDDRDLIKTILENLMLSKTKVRLWQKLSSMHKVNYGKIKSIDLIENKVILKPYSGSKFFLSPSPFIYFHSHHRTTLFKTNIKDRNCFSLEIKVPQFVKIQEGRTENRKPLGVQSVYSASIKLDGRGKEFSVQVLDISPNGAALGVPLHFFDHCEIGSLLSINSGNVNHLSGRIAVIRNKAAYCPDPTRPNFLKYRLGLEIFKEEDLSEYFDQE